MWNGLKTNTQILKQPGLTALYQGKPQKKFGFKDQLSLNAGQKYCKMLQEKHSAILSTVIKLPFVIKTFVLSIFEWLFYTGFTVPLW